MSDIGPRCNLTLETIADHIQVALDQLPEHLRPLRMAAMLRNAAQWGRQTARYDRWERAVESALLVRYPEPDEVGGEFPRAEGAA